MRKPNAVLTASTAIQSVYHREKENTLVVNMTDGTYLEYEDVPKKVYEEFLEAESKGSFFNRRIRNSYSVRK